MKYKWLLFVICGFIFFTACSAPAKVVGGSEDTVKESLYTPVPIVRNIDDKDAGRFFVKEAENAMCSEYIICYEETNGDITEIINMGIENHPFIIQNKRIFFTQGGSLFSVDFSGKDKKVFLPQTMELESIDDIMSFDKDWIYCSGTVMREVTGDPVALDGYHSFPVDTKIKLDFSDFELME